MDALLEDDDDVGPVVAEKLANITNKATCYWKCQEKEGSS